MLKLHVYTVNLRKYFHLPQVIDKQQAWQEHSRLKRSSYTIAGLINLLYFVGFQGF